VRNKSEPSLKNRALQYLARREYSREELRAKLLRHARNGDAVAPQAEIDLDGLLDDLAARGWLSDQRAAEQLVDRRRARFGLQRITNELQQKGLDDSLIDDVLPRLQETELDTAREVWLRKFGVPPADAKERARQMRFLQSRGFSLETIRNVLKTHLSIDGQ
jgi:regulatory protein